MGSKLLLLAVLAFCAFLEATAFYYDKSEMPEVTLNDGSKIVLGESDAALRAGKKYQRSVQDRLDRLAEKAAAIRPVIVDPADTQKFEELKRGHASMSYEYIQDAVTKKRVGQMLKPVNTFTNTREDTLK